MVPSQFLGQLDGHKYKNALDQTGNFSQGRNGSGWCSDPPVGQIIFTGNRAQPAIVALRSDRQVFMAKDKLRSV